MREGLVASTAVAVGSLEAVAMAWQTRIIGNTLDELSLGNSPRTYLVQFAFSIACILVLEALWQSSYAAYRQLVIHRLRQSVFKATLRGNTLRLSEESIGELSSRVNVDVPAVAKEYYETRLGAVVDGLMAAVYFLALLQITWQYSLAVTSFAVLTVFVPFIFKKKIARLREDALLFQSSYNGIFSGALRSLMDLRIGVALSNTEARVADASAKQSRREFEHGCLLALSNVSVGLTNFVSRLVLLVIGSYLILRGSSSAGDFVAAFQLSGLMVQPVVRAARALNIYSGGKRAFNNLKQEGYLNAYKTDPFVAFSAQKTTDVCSFSWKNLELNLLDSERRVSVTDCTLVTGENLAITGVSGNGKSTLCYALVGLLPLTKGEVCVDGDPISVISEDQRFAHVQLVPQDGRIFRGSIVENVDLGRGFDIPEIRNALKRAGFDQCALRPIEYLHRLHDPSSFSGGERQRLCLARALVLRPRVLILDEALSQVDRVTRERVMNDLLGDPSMIVIFVSHQQEPGIYEVRQLGERSLSSDRGRR